MGKKITIYIMDKHRGMIHPNLLSIGNKIAQSVLPGNNMFSAANTGTPILGNIIFTLMESFIGKSMGPFISGFRQSIASEALKDASDIIRVLMYFFYNIIISAFFKDVETMFLNEHHEIDDEFMGLGITLKQIHNSLTNGLISFIYTIVMDNHEDMIGGASSSIDSNVSDMVKKHFNLQNVEFKKLLLVNDDDGDPYDLNSKDNKDDWGKSFTRLLKGNVAKDKEQKGKKHPKHANQVILEGIKRRIEKMTSDVSESQLEKIISLLEGIETKPHKNLESGSMLEGGSKTSSHTANYSYPGNEGTKHFFYNLYLFESLLNSEKFIDTYVLIFNLICKLINRLIKRLIPLMRRMTKKTLNNVGAFVFSIFGPFTEVIWFAFSTMMGLFDAGSTMFHLSNDVKSVVSINEADNSMLSDDDKDKLNDILSLYKQISAERTSGGGGCKNIHKVLKKFDKMTKRFFYDHF